MYISLALEELNDLDHDSRPVVLFKNKSLNFISST